MRSVSRWSGSSSSCNGSRKNEEWKSMQPDWPAEIYKELVSAGVRVVGYVPDAAHKRLIKRCHEDRHMRAVPLSTEEEGIGLVAGAWLGGEKSVLLMQSSG